MIYLFPPPYPPRCYIIKYVWFPIVLVCIRRTIIIYIVISILRNPRFEKTFSYLRYTIQMYAKVGEQYNYWYFMTYNFVIYYS